MKTHRKYGEKNVGRFLLGGGRREGGRRRWILSQLDQSPPDIPNTQHPDDQIIGSNLKVNARDPHSSHIFRGGKGGALGRSLYLNQIIFIGLVDVRSKESHTL